MLVEQGLSLRVRGDLPAAERALRAALIRYPRDAIAATNLGIVLLQQNQIQQGAELLLRALDIDPGFGPAHFNLANLHRASGRIDDAIFHYAEAVSSNSFVAPAREHLMMALAEVCDWGRAQIEADALRALVRQGSRKNWLPAVSPLTAVYLELGADNSKLAASHHAREAAREVKTVSRNMDLAQHHRLRIGYLSHDFRDHPVGHLMRGALELHDRRRFEIYAFSSGPDDGSAYRKSISAGADHFIDIAGRTDDDAARDIASSGVHILIDLMGHTTGNRLGLLARRPAPVQAHYLGYAGTTGASYIDYFVSDTIASPRQSGAEFTEQLALLPRGFMISNGFDAVASVPAERSGQGLPDDGVVYCNFANSSRITREVFTVWMEILRSVPKAVLWLKQSHELTVENLRRESRQQGVDPARLVFAQRVAGKQSHLARIGLADLALDTIGWHNGHSNTCDMLWAGVPVVTTLGSTFASRVAASVLHAAGLPELVSPNKADYLKLAVELGGDSARIAALKRKLADNRRSVPFFNQRSTVADLESVYEAMWRNHEIGRAPQFIGT